VTELSGGDIVVDDGNSNYRDSVRRAATLAQKGICFLDVGASGGIWGKTEGYCLMICGDEKAFHHLEPVFQMLAQSPKTGYGYVSQWGSSFRKDGTQWH
jgi:6-phosphogluconate dehydrogenase